MTLKSITVLSGVLAAFLFMCPHGRAADQTETEIALYGFVPSITSGSGSGSSTTGYDGVAVDFEYTTSDILNALDMAFMGYIEHRRDHWIFLFDGLYARFSGDRTLLSNGLITIETEGKISQTMLAGFVGYNAYNHDFSHQSTLFLDVLGGLRHNDIDMKFGTEASLVGLTTVSQREGSAKWQDAVVALRARYHYDSWGAMGWIDYGHGPDDSQSMQLMAHAHYQWDNGVRLFGGYRYYTIERSVSNGGTSNDAEVSLDYSGPLIGVAYQF